MTRVPFPRPDLIRSGRVSRHAPCPACGALDQCVALVHETRADVLQVWCVRGVRDGGQAVAWGFRGQVWYYELALDGTARPPAPRASAAWAPLAPPAVRARVLGGIERCWPLTAAHRARLAQRGYPLDRCQLDGWYHFASLPADVGARYRLVLDLLAQGTATSDADVLGTYGFRRGVEDLPVFLPQVAGAALIEFILDAAATFVGFQYAPDTPVLHHGKPVKRLSPPRQESLHLYHAAWGAADHGTTCYHVEGIHKANLVAYSLPTVAVASIGVGNVTGAVAGALAVDPDRQRTHVVCIDADRRDSRDETRLLTQLRDTLGYRVTRGRWQAPYNGPDDAVVAGATIYQYPYVDDVFDGRDFL